MVSPNLIPGQILGHFRLIEQIGAGGMGVVYRAWDTRLERDVAVKVLNSQTLIDGAARQRFRREALILSRLNHPNVESVYDFHSDQGVDYLVLEYVPGTSLNERIRKGALPEPELLALAIQLARGLAGAHQQRIIHRDLKPGNLRVTPDNVLKILDFGLAEVFILPEEETVLDTGSRQSSDAGTPAYLSPEQIDGKEPDVRSDIYSAGLVLYEMATGSLPFPQRGQMLRDAILHRLPPSPRLRNKELSADMEAVILKCLEKDPKLRYQSASELLEDLQELSRDSGPHRPIAVPETSKHRRVWIAAALLAVILLAVAGLVFRNRVLEQFGIVPRTVSLAVLPLHNRTGNPKLDYLGAGISEALTDDLSRMTDLQVTAASVARRYGGDGLDPRDAGRTLQVKSVLDGSITTQDGVVQVPIELIDVQTGRRLWGQTYAGDLTHLADLQHQISTDVAYRLKLKFDPDAKARLKRQYSTNPSAYDSYLKGRFHLSQRSPDSLQEAITDFQRALEQDPQYAPAYAGLADCYSLLGYYGLQKPIPLFTKGMAAAQQALEIDSTLGEAYTSRALARTFLNFDWTGAEADYKRAIELNPKYVTAHTWYGLLLLMPLGRRSEAAAQLAYTQSADPNSLVGSISLATMDYLAGDFDKSIELIESRSHTLPPFEPALQILALDYLGKNMPEKVIELLEAASLPPEILRQRVVPLGIAYVRSGQKSKAREQLKLAEASIRSGYVLCYETAALYTALHDHSHALDMLELAYERRESNVVFLNVDPLLEPLRSEPRFKKLLAAINVW